jgi:hypothetical protein
MTCQPRGTMLSAERASVWPRAVHAVILRTQSASHHRDERGRQCKNLCPPIDRIEPDHTYTRPLDSHTDVDDATVGTTVPQLPFMIVGRVPDR